MIVPLPRTRFDYRPGVLGAAISAEMARRGRSGVRGFDLLMRCNGYGNRIQRFSCFATMPRLLKPVILLLIAVATLPCCKKRDFVKGRSECAGRAGPSEHGAYTGAFMDRRHGNDVTIEAIEEFETMVETSGNHRVVESLGEKLFHREHERDLASWFAAAALLVAVDQPYEQFAADRFGLMQIIAAMG